MLKMIAAIFLASLLAVMAYGVFWLVCLAYTTNQMRDAVHEALQADMTYGSAQWVPDIAHVTMSLPNVKITMQGGPVREIRASEIRLVSGFLTRDSWTMELPPRLEVVLANGKTLRVETTDAEVAWLEDGNQLSLRAGSVHLMDSAGHEMARVNDIMLERKAADNGVRLNLASRPQMAGGEAIINGQMVLPDDAFAHVVNLYGGDTLPGLGDILRTIAMSLKQDGGTLKLDNVSFKLPGGASGAVFGEMQVHRDDTLDGNMAVTADNGARLLGWLAKANMMRPRSNAENAGTTRIMHISGSRPVVRFENMQGALVLNGAPVGPLPHALDVVGRLWP